MAGPTLAQAKSTYASKDISQHLNDIYLRLARLEYLADQTRNLMNSLINNLQKGEANK